MVGFLLAGGIHQVSAFSLFGEFAEWQEEEIGYQLPTDLGGPMNLGEEYRMNLRTITYGYDPSFLNYFGQEGVEVVEKAIKILNDLPPFSQMSDDLSEFEENTALYNNRAQALGVLDLKSFALGSMMEVLGLAAPERFVWTLRSRDVIADIPFYNTIQRNFDPVTWEPTPYVNGKLFTYQILQTFVDPDIWEAVPFGVDPFGSTITTVASFGINNGTVDLSGFSTLGLYFTGLTRDDVGGLRYIYHQNNFNVENLPANVAASTNLVSSGDSPWTPIGGGGPGAVLGTNVVDQALRAGVEELKFERVRFDSQLGEFVALTNSYQDRFITNSTQRSQTLQRIVVEPDILFGAEDIGVDPDGDVFARFRSFVITNNDEINGQTTLAGPGVIEPQAQILFTKLGPFFQNTPEGNEENAFQGFIWGHFDSSTNLVIFPEGRSLMDLEARVLDGDGLGESGDAWRVVIGGAAGGGGAGTGTGGGGTDPNIPPPGNNPPPGTP
jgi:hypothetical protein